MFVLLRGFRSCCLDLLLAFGFFDLQGFVFLQLLDRVWCFVTLWKLIC